jgi:hypothetical protein
MPSFFQDLSIRFDAEVNRGSNYLMHDASAITTKGVLELVVVGALEQLGGAPGGDYAAASHQHELDG